MGGLQAPQAARLFMLGLLAMCVALLPACAHRNGIVPEAASGGNDFYRAESLAQGAAAQQSRAWLFDAGGNDVYWSSGESAQGVAGDNSYHFLDDDPVVSLGVLLDAGGDDRYSTGLADGEIRIRHAPGNPAKGRDNSGVAIDESP